MESAQLHGIILAGGKSSRMGRPKEQLVYHGKPQLNWLHDLLEPLCTKTWVSLSEKPPTSFPYPYLLDQEFSIGPMAALLAAFQQFPQYSFLLIACDMPFVNQESLEVLIQARSNKQLITAYKNQAGLPEPLLSVWEPESYKELKKAQEEKQYGLRKLMQENPTKLLEASDLKLLSNINTPEEYKKIKAHD